MPEESEFVPWAALLFILVVMIIVTVAWLAMYAVLLNRGWS